MQPNIITIILLRQPRLRARIAEAPSTMKEPWCRSAGSSHLKQPMAQRTGPFCPYSTCARTRLRFPCSEVSGRKLLFFVVVGHAVMWDPSSLSRDQTRAPCSGSAESQPLDHQGSPRNLLKWASCVSFWSPLPGRPQTIAQLGRGRCLSSGHSHHSWGTALCPCTLWTPPLQPHLVIQLGFTQD